LNYDISIVAHLQGVVNAVIQQLYWAVCKRRNHQRLLMQLMDDGNVECTPKGIVTALLDWIAALARTTHCPLSMVRNLDGRQLS